MKAPKFTSRVRANARKLLQDALALAQQGEEDPVIVTGVARKVSLAGKVWECAYAAREAARVALRRPRAPLTSQRVLNKAIELLNNGWGS